MRRLLPVALLLCGLAAAAPGASSEKQRSHGYSLSGTITRVDEATKTLVVKTAAGKETTLVRTTGGDEGSGLDSSEFQGSGASPRIGARANR